MTIGCVAVSGEAVMRQVPRDVTNEVVCDVAVTGSVAKQRAHAFEIFGRVDTGQRRVIRHEYGDSLAVPQRTQLFE